MYLEDGRSEFVRKEDMDAQLPLLIKNLEKQITREGVEVGHHYFSLLGWGQIGRAVQPNIGKKG